MMTSSKEVAIRLVPHSNGERFKGVATLGSCGRSRRVGMEYYFHYLDWKI